MPIVEDLDVLEDRPLSLGLGMKRLQVHELSLERTEERLHDGVIEAAPPAAHALTYMPAPQNIPHFEAGVLSAPVGMEDQPGCRPPRLKSLEQGVDDQVLRRPLPQPPADDLSIVDIHHGSQVKPALPGPDIRDSRDPEPIGRSRREVPLH